MVAQNNAEGLYQLEWIADSGAGRDLASVQAFEAQGVPSNVVYKATSSKGPVGSKPAIVKSPVIQSFMPTVINLVMNPFACWNHVPSFDHWVGLWMQVGHLCGCLVNCPFLEMM